MAEQGRPQPDAHRDAERDADRVQTACDAPRLASRNKALPLSVVARGMVARRVSVVPSDVVFVKGLLEASDGLAAVFAERGGELTIVAPLGRERELAELLADLEADLGARLDPEPEVAKEAW